MLVTKTAERPHSIDVWSADGHGELYAIEAFLGRPWIIWIERLEFFFVVNGITNSIQQ